MPPPHFEQWPKERVFLGRSSSSLMPMSVSMSMIVSANWFEQILLQSWCNKWLQGLKRLSCVSFWLPFNFHKFHEYYNVSRQELSWVSQKKLANHCMAKTQFFVFVCTQCTCSCLCHCICFLLIRPRPGQKKTRGCPKKYANRMLLEPWCTGSITSVFFGRFLLRLSRIKRPKSCPW